MKMMKHLMMLLTAAVMLVRLGAAELFDWSGAKQVAPGMLHSTRELAEPRLMKINVVRVDLKTPGLRVMTGHRDPDWGKTMPDAPDYIIRTKRQTTRDFLLGARRNNIDMVLAVNASGFAPWRKPFNHTYADRVGLMISDGDIINLDTRNPAVVFWKDGTVSFIDRPGQLTVEQLNNIRVSVGAFHRIMTDGKVTGSQDVHPRTGFGLDSTGRYLYIMTIDGRQKGYSEGATTRELAEQLQYFGAYNALNMDGGGSTTLILWNGKESVRLNRFNGERRVGSSLGFYFEKPAPAK